VLRHHTRQPKGLLELPEASLHGQAAAERQCWGLCAAGGAGGIPCNQVHTLGECMSNMSADDVTAIAVVCMVSVMS
jgi:hypothetical protein